MAAYTSTQDGDWDVAATWGGGGTPGVGDTASIGHNVSATADETIGTEPDDDSTYVITVTSGGHLTIEDGVTLTVRGNVQLNGAGGSLTTNLTIQGSGKLLFDGSPVSSSRTYRLRCEFRTAFVLDGTDDDNRATIEADAGGGYWQMFFQGASPHFPDGDYGLIKRAGDNSNAAMTNNNNAFASGETISWTNMKFEECGLIRVQVKRDDQSFTMEDTEFANSAETGTVFQLTHDGPTTQVSTINRCIFDSRVQIQTDSHYVLATNNYFGNGVNNANGDLGWASGSGNNLTVNSNGSTATWRGDYTDNYYFHNYLDGQNYGYLNYESGTGTFEISDNIWDFGTTSAAQPDGIIIQDIDTGDHVDILRNIVLPDTAGVSSGAWVNFYSSTLNGDASIEHNTVVVADSGSQHGVWIGELGGGSGLIDSFKSNLTWTPGGETAGHHIVRSAGSTTQDYVAAADADYNWGWNLDADPYHVEDDATAFFSSGTPDGNGGSGDPQFVDSSRNLIRFDIDYLGNPAGTAWADMTAYAVGDIASGATSGFVGGDTVNFRCINPHTSNDGHATDGKPGVATNWRTNWEYVSTYRLREDLTRIADLIAWVRAGFAVQNASLSNAGHDGATIGAGEFSGPIVTNPAPVAATWSAVAPSSQKSAATTPAAASWGAATPSAAKLESPTPVAADWSAVTPSALKSIDAPVIAADWSGVAPEAVSTTTVAPASAAWGAVAPEITKQINVSAVAASWSTVSLGTTIITAPGPVAADWSAVAPDAVKVVTPDAISAAWSAVAAETTLGDAIDPVSADWSAVAPEVTKTAGIGPVSADWGAVAVGAVKDTDAPAIAADWSTGEAIAAITIPAVAADWGTVAIDASKAAETTPVGAAWTAALPAQAIGELQPVEADWSVVAVGAGKDTDLAPVSVTWSGVAPSSAKLEGLPPLAAGWNVGPEGILATPSPVTADWSSVAPTVSRISHVSPIAADWGVAAVDSIHTVTVDALTANWSTGSTEDQPIIGVASWQVAPIEDGAMSPLSVNWETIAPGTAKADGVDPVAAAWTAIAPDVSSLAAIDGAVIAWSISAPSAVKVVEFSPLVATWGTQTIAHSKAHASPVGAAAWSATVASIAFELDPVAASWSAVAPSLEHGAFVDAVVAAWSVADVGAERLQAVDPVVASWSTEAIETPKGGEVDALVAAWSAIAPTVERVFPVTVVGADWAAGALSEDVLREPPYGVSGALV